MGEIKDFVLPYLEDPELLAPHVNGFSIDLRSNIQTEAPYLEGRIRRSIRVDTRFYDKYALVTGYWDESVAPHGIYVLAGTRPHEIRPFVKKALSWPGMTTDYPVGKVNHPGTKPNDFLGRGLAKTLEAYI